MQRINRPIPNSNKLRMITDDIREAKQPHLQMSGGHLKEYVRRASAKSLYFLHIEYHKARIAV